MTSFCFGPFVSSYKIRYLCSILLLKKRWIRQIVSWTKSGTNMSPNACSLIELSTKLCLARAIDEARRAWAKINVTAHTLEPRLPSACSSHERWQQSSSLLSQVPENPGKGICQADLPSTEKCLLNVQPFLRERVLTRGHLWLVGGGGSEASSFIFGLTAIKSLM